MRRLVGGASGPLTPPEARRELVVTSADGARLHVEEHGAASGDGPTVVLVHGWTCATAFWAPVVRALTADGHRVITYDQRGHGRTPAADPERYGTAVLGDDLCAVLDQTLTAGEQAVLGGHSMGAITLMAAAERPQLREHAAALMFSNTGASRLLPTARVVPLGPARLRARVQAGLLSSSLPLGPVTPVSRRLLRYGTMGRGASRDEIDACAFLVHACPRRVRAAWGRVLGGLDLTHQLARLTQPTAVLTGTADRLTPSAHAHRIVASLPRCVDLREVNRRGHMTPVEEPEVVVDVLAGLVRDHVTERRAGAVTSAAAVGEETSRETSREETSREETSREETSREEKWSA